MGQMDAERRDEQEARYRRLEQVSRLANTAASPLAIARVKQEIAAMPEGADKRQVERTLYRRILQLVAMSPAHGPDELPRLAAMAEEVLR